MDFSQRSPEKELLDRDDIPFPDIERNMQELDFINTWLGGHAITVSGVKKLLALCDHKGADLHICEIGCGGGDNLVAVSKWCRRNAINARFTGIDINPLCIAVARKKTAGLSCRLIASDYLAADLSGDLPDLVFSSLFCHHFTNVELTGMLQWMQQNARYGFFINDLQRHPLAYHSIKGLTQLFSSSYLVKNDAPLSVKRGFIRPDWESLLHAAGIQRYSVEWKWAFRYLVSVVNRNNPVTGNKKL